MLNGKGQRELAYVVEIDKIMPIEGADRVELAIVGGWQIMVQKGTVISQGLLMHPNDFGWIVQVDNSIWNPAAGDHGRYDKGAFLTEELGVIYYDPEDNVRKVLSGDKYKKMAGRHPKLFQGLVFRSQDGARSFKAVSNEFLLKYHS